MPDKNWQFEFEEYIRQGGLEKAEKSETQQTAFGLQKGIYFTTKYFGIVFLKPSTQYELRIKNCYIAIKAENAIRNGKFGLNI